MSGRCWAGPSQSCQNVLRSLRNVEVLRICFEYEEVNNYIVFQLSCRHGASLGPRR